MKVEYATELSIGPGGGGGGGGDVNTGDVPPPPPPQAAIKTVQATNTMILLIDLMLYYLNDRQSGDLGSFGSHPWLLGGSEDP